MQKNKSGTWRLLYNKADLDFFESIQNKEFEIVDVLKDDYRSKVYRIRLSDRDLVLKIPNEKNTQPWIRFLTWFRIGEAFKNIKGMQKLRKLGISTTTPVMAAERRSFGMVVDSWLVYEYLDGHSCLDQKALYPKVVDQLKVLHQKGVLHSDAQIRNFMHLDEKIYVIDSNPKSVSLFGFDKAYEFAYLRKSAPGIEKYYGDINESFLYRFAISYDIYDRKLARFRKKIKRFFKRLVGLEG